MPTMTASTPGRTAALRGAYWAVGSGLLTALGTWASTDDPKPIIIAGATAALVALGFRGAVEGSFDGDRAAKGDVRAGDVGQS